MGKEKLLISSCLLGSNVKYNGGNNILSEDILKKLETKYEIYPCCPEVDGGLPIPRIPCEIVSSDPIKVVNKNNEDKTKEFLIGASKAFEICKENNIKIALLKSNSPSCSNKYIYDGSFSSKKIQGYGVTTQTLLNKGIKVYSEDEIGKLI